jgi:hypothetical protein
MSFLWAYAELTAGRKVRIPAYAPGCYVYINEHKIMMFHSPADYVGRFNGGGAQKGSEWPFKLDWKDIQSEWELSTDGTDDQSS